MNTAAKRFVARQLLHAIGTHMHVDLHELDRLDNALQGLTDKERAFLKKTVIDYRLVCERVSKLGQHIQKGL